MLMKEEKNNFESSIFYKVNMKINRNLPKVYALTLLFSVIVIFVGMY